MGEIKLYSKEKYGEDLQSYSIPALGWFCRIAGGTCRIFFNSADIDRYRKGLRKAAEREMAKVQFFTCQKGIISFVIEEIDRGGLLRIIRSANAGYGKYRRYIGEKIDFFKWEPVPIQTPHQRSEIVGKIFNILCVADNTVSDV